MTATKKELLCCGYSRIYSLIDHIPMDIINFISIYYGIFVISLAAPSQSLEYVPPKALYYFSKKEKKSYILVTPYHEDTRDCMKYDVANNKWCVFTTYPTGFNPAIHANEIDNDNELLYILGGQSSGDGVFGIFDLKNSKWDIKCKIDDPSNMERYNIPNRMTEAATWFVNHPIHEMHIFGMTGAHSAHYKLSADLKFVKASNNGINNNFYCAHPAMVYIRINDDDGQLLILGGYTDDSSDDIYYTTITKSDENEDYEWKKWDIKLPFKSGGFPVIVAFETVIIAKEDKEIWCLDTNGKKPLKWIKCDVEEDSPFMCLDAQHGYVHFLSMARQKHKKIPLSELLPSEIYNNYK